MKKYLILLTATFFTFHFSGKTQDTTHIRVGFFFAPQGGISLKTPGKVFSTVAPLAFATQFIKGNGGINIMYSITFNAVQAVYFHKVHGSLGAYVVGSKRVLAKGGYAGTGVTLPVADGRAVGFIEFGSPWNNWSPAIYMGAIIPLTLKIK